MIRNSQMNNFLDLSIYRLIAFVVFIICLLSLLDAAIPQLQLLLLGHVLAGGNSIVKITLLLAVTLGTSLFPRIRGAELPLRLWLICIVYLMADVPHLIQSRGMTLGDVFLSYNAYYLLLIGPALLAFRGALPERVTIRYTLLAFWVCAAIGLAQYATNRPILQTETADGSFTVVSWEFFDQVRAFSLFTSSMNFGIFCGLCGALGVALYRNQRVKGAFVFIVSAIACYITLTRLSYLIFICVCTYALVLTFGKKPGRGLYYPLLYFALGMLTIAIGLGFSVGDTNNLRDPGSLISRIEQWGFYYELLLHTSVTDLLFGLGIVQNEKILPLFPMVIDNTPLALVLHIGFVGLALFGTLMVKMWLYLRREALTSRQPFMIAAASLWASLACAGIFNIVFSSVGTVFALAILCAKAPSIAPRLKRAGRAGGTDKGVRPEISGSRATEKLPNMIYP